MDQQHHQQRGLNERATPAQMLDQALTLLRHASAEQWLRGVFAGLPLAAVLLGLYALEHVVGARPPLALFGLLSALAYWARFRGLSVLARELTCVLAPHGELRESGSAPGRFDTAMVAGIGSCLWALGLFTVAQSSLAWLLVCFPILCARGAIAPSLLARAACAPETGLQALARATGDTRGQRQLFLGVELLALLGLLLVFGNLYALTVLALLVASSVLGLDVGFVSALIAPDNEIVPLLLLGVSALVLEPLRAAISALAYQRARERWEGADLYAAFARLSPAPRRRAHLQPNAAERRLLVLLVLCTPALAHADDQAAEVDALDLQVRREARDILARDEFLPSATDSGEGSFRQWLAARMGERELSDRDASAPPRFELRLPPSALVLGSTVLMVCVGFGLTRGLRRRKARVAAALRGVTAQPTSDDRLAEASRLAAEAQYDLGLRSLYAACLSVLGGFDSAQTNGEVLKRLQSSPLRAAFASFTQVFEPCCYGRQRATRDDFERAQALTSQIMREATAQRAQQVQP